MGTVCSWTIELEPMIWGDIDPLLVHYGIMAKTKTVYGCRHQTDSGPVLAYCGVFTGYHNCWHQTDSGPIPTHCNMFAGLTQVGRDQRLVEAKIQGMLLKMASPMVRPVRQRSDAVPVRLGIVLHHVLNIVRKCPKLHTYPIPWWRYSRENMTALLAFCEGNHRLMMDSIHKGPVM